MKSNKFILVFFMLSLPLAASAAAPQRDHQDPGEFQDNYTVTRNADGCYLVTADAGFRRIYIRLNGTLTSLYLANNGSFHVTKKPLKPSYASQIERQLGNKLISTNSLADLCIRFRTADGTLYDLTDMDGKYIRPVPHNPGSSGSSSTSSSSSGSGDDDDCDDDGVDCDDQDTDPIDDGGHGGSDPICRLAGTCGGTSGSGSTSSSSSSTSSSSSGSTSSGSGSTSSSSSSSSSSGGGSGVSWPSGAFSAVGKQPWASIGDGRFDYCLVYTPGRISQGTWADVENAGGAYGLRDSSKCANFMISLRIFPADRGTENPRDRGCVIWKNAAEGQYDSHWIKMAQSLKRSAPSNAIIRTGWELSHRYPWTIAGCRTDEEVNWYKAGHRHLVDILREHYSREFKISWNFLRGSNKLPRPILDYYPGGDYVDFVSVDYYDAWWPQDNTTLEAFNRNAATGTPTHPNGIATWLALAKSVGKKLTVDEWGITTTDCADMCGGDGRGAATGGDNPVFIEGMYNFFRANSEHIGAELYFNSNGSNLGVSSTPRATAKYRELWGSE